MKETIKKILQDAIEELNEQLEDDEKLQVNKQLLMVVEQQILQNNMQGD